MLIVSEWDKKLSDVYSFLGKYINGTCSKFFSYLLVLLKIPVVIILKGNLKICVLLPGISFAVLCDMIDTPTTSFTNLL